MVQAIQVLRFHLLELEKVSHYFCQLKTFQPDRKTLDRPDDKWVVAV